MKKQKEICACCKTNKIKESEIIGHNYFTGAKTCKNCTTYMADEDARHHNFMEGLRGEAKIFAKSHINGTQYNNI